MKKTILYLITLFCVSLGYAQSDIIAVSGSNKNTIEFQDFRFIDLNKNLEQVITVKNAEIPEEIVGMTYDARNQKLIFIGLHSPDVYSYDFSTSKYERLFATGKAYSKCALSQQFSRMATDVHGVSFALNNSSNQLIKIQPSKTGYLVEVVGGLTADFKLDQYKYYGGDLVADNAGNLFLVSANHHIIKINTHTLQADYIGEIKGIEKGFSTNGAAVMANGQVLLSNAKGKGFYTLNMETLEAKRFDNSSTTAIYDLASPYLLQNKKAEALTQNAVQVYPSKIKDREVTIALNHAIEDIGIITIHDIAGNLLIKTQMDLMNSLNVKKLNLNSLRPGNYYIKVVDTRGNELINEKIIILK